MTGLWLVDGARTRTACLPLALEPFRRQDGALRQRAFSLSRLSDTKAMRWRKMAECFSFEGHGRVACACVSTIRFTDTSQPNTRLRMGRGRLFSRDELE